ncbi:MAG TPA: GntR family transcriptional regulator [Mesorhizobium sp.]|jgi:DNA-binding GntR family transcriptional regulator|nr:GntR family transcriptional regulator [Mesorhizobium sp.]
MHLDEQDGSGSLAAQAYRAVERRIVTLELAPGSVTSEAALAEAVGLGRTPIREAVQRLAWEGLLEIRPRAGLAVALLHPGDWVRVIDAREGVEVVLARAAARFGGEAHSAAFRQAAETIKAAAERNDVESFLGADKLLDEATAAAASNPFAARLAAPLQTHSRRFWFRFQGASGLNQAAERHAGLVEAILAGDERKAMAEASRLMAELRLQAEAVARA